MVTAMVALLAPVTGSVAGMPAGSVALTVTL